jgi:TnpA family transposase
LFQRLLLVVYAYATFAARQSRLWGEGSTAVASDSTHFRAWDQNIFTQWHSRYRDGKRSVLIYWTVEKGGAMIVHSQLLECSASEVHAMVEGAMRHGTDMEIKANYVDTHGHLITWTPRATTGGAGWRRGPSAEAILRRFNSDVTHPTYAHFIAGPTLG